MPQLTPLYFVGETVFTFGLVIVMIYLFSKYVLPKFVQLQSVRVFINKL